MSVDEALLAPGKVLVEVELSVVSAGTEVANFTGLDQGTRKAESWNYYPRRPGYGAIGKVVAVGPPPLDHGVAVGDRVYRGFANGDNASSLSTPPISSTSATSSRRRAPTRPPALGRLTPTTPSVKRPAR